MQDLCNKLKHNIHIPGVIGEGREKRAENSFEELIAENIPNRGKETDIQVHEAQKPQTR